LKILVLGAGGMAGHLVSLYLRENGLSVDTLSARHAIDKNTRILDVTDSAKFRIFLDSTKYDIVINCIGLLIKQSEERKDLAAYLNSYLPHFLEKYYSDSQTKIIHLSTDCVFSGQNPPYRENSPYDAQTFYDRSKALGEILNNKDLTFRMSIIGPDMNKDGIGLFNWFYQQSGEVSGFTKAIWNGITTLELAKGIKAAIEQNLIGVYHLVPKDNISKYDLLLLFKDTFGRTDINIKPDNKTMAGDKTLINTRKDFDNKVPDYKIMVQEMKNWIDSHNKLYKHYA
jgi:dTDP-4-dehydrorhamnose reductase